MLIWISQGDGDCRRRIDRTYQTQEARPHSRQSQSICHPAELELIKSFSPRLENRKEENNEAHKWCERVSITVANQRQLLEASKMITMGPLHKRPIIDGTKRPTATNNCNSHTWPQLFENKR